MAIFLQHLNLYSFRYGKLHLNIVTKIKQFRED